MDYHQLAQDIVRGNKSNINSNSFHESSFIYKKTNERLEEIIKHFKDKKRIMSVISSGDQILNMMLSNPIYIDAFDISVFPQYFLKLKIAAIKSLTREEYITFFFDTILTTNDELYDDLYFDKISKYLDKDSKEFWDYLFEYNDWFDIYNSTLFSQEPVILSRALDQNRYLKTEEYYRLKENISNIRINYIVENILDINIEDEYDLIYLSNIFQYVNVSSYIEKVKTLVNNNGEVLTYVFGETDELSKYIPNTKTYKFDGNELLIHKK